MSDFDQRAKEECTKNPVFLFQLRQWIYTGLPVFDVEWNNYELRKCDECGKWKRPDRKCNDCNIREK